MLFTFLKGYIKFFFVYFFFGFFAILSLFFIMAWAIQLNTGESYYDSIIYLTNLSDSDFLGTFQYFISKNVPLSDLFEQLFGDSDILKGFGSFFEYSRNLITGKQSVSKQQMFADLFPDIVKIAIADLILFFLKKIKQIFSFLKGFSVSLGFLFAGIFWIAACYTFSSLTLIWIEKYTATITNRYTVYWCVFIFCLILRALLTAFDPLSLKLKIDVFPFVFLFLLETVFGVFNSIFAWLFFTNFNSPVYFWETFFFFAIYKLLKLFIEWSLLKISFPNLARRGAITALFYLL
ncbi:MAG: hypothetical protein IJX75_00075 [Clostridia bacterium]|nr:hypothetical protein [Clostridia bacterium]